MKQMTISVYSFDELSAEAKKKAIETIRNSNNNNGGNQFYFDEIILSVKEVAELFNLKFGRKYTDIRTGHIDDNILELSGIRLYKYLMNNYYISLFKPAYIKTIDKHVFYKQFICKRAEGYEKKPYTQIYSRIRTTSDCTLTGVCYDNDILHPIYDFLKKPCANTTFEDLIKDIENAIQKAFDDCEEWTNSDEFIIDQITANNYEFEQDGTEY